MGALRRAGGKVVSYEELRESGIELPASVVSELELAGIPIERRWQESDGGRRLGVRLDPAFEPDRAEPEETAPMRTRPVRPLVPIGLVVVAILVAVVVVIALGGGRTRDHRVARRPSRVHARTTALAGAPHGSTTPSASASSPPTPVSPGLATQFEAQGHNLLQAGQYTQAVPVLKRALQATGEQLNDCIEPVSQTCLTYAYALYDLGRALQLNGNATAAVPVLKQRLEIDNQRGVVQSELAAARASAS